MTPQQRRSLLLALPIAFLVGLGLFSGGFYFAAQQVELLLEGESASGTVVALEPGSSTSGGGRAALFPIVAFDTNSGQVITFRHRTGDSPAAYREGERVPVTYLPGSPEDALIAEGFRNWLLPLVLLLCGAGLAVVTGYGLIRMRRAG